MTHARRFRLPPAAETEAGERTRRVLVALLASVTAGGWIGVRGAPPADAFAPPPILHVFAINLENTSYRESFGTPSAARYLATRLPARGALLRQYFGIGHESLDNYIAQVSGQGPSPETQADCPTFLDFRGTTGGPNGQAVGQGCVYPEGVLTIGDQMEAAGLTWKGYMEDMGNDPVGDGGTRCAHPPIDGQDRSGNRPGDAYATRHNPFVYFRSVIDHVASCRVHVVPLTELRADLRRIRTTPNLSYITPNLVQDGHDTDITHASEWLRTFLRPILKSTAYRRNGMVVVTFDEAEFSPSGWPDPDDVAACCNEIPGPNTPMPGIAGPGGGRIGAIVLSPFIRPGTVSDVPYNHYSLLRSLEDLFRIVRGGDDGLGHLGFAGTYDIYAGPGSFGPDVYTASRRRAVRNELPSGDTRRSRRAQVGRAGWPGGRSGAGPTTGARVAPALPSPTGGTFARRSMARPVSGPQGRGPMP